MHRILMRKWTWQWLALLGLLAVIFHVTLQGWIWVDEVLLKDEPIPVFYDYPYSDVALAKKGGPPYPPTPPFDPILTSIFKNKEAPLAP